MSTMGLFDYFTNDAQTRAAADQAAGINAGLAQYGGFAGQGREALTNYGAGALGSVTGGVNAGSSALSSNYGAGINSLAGDYGQAQGALGQNYGAGIGALGQNYGAGIGALGTTYGAGIGALSSNYGAGQGALGAGQGALAQNYGAGINALTGAYGAGLQPNQWNFGQGQQGTQQYGNALGLNGPQGNAQATAAFWNNPAIQSQLDIGSENVLRNQARSGQLASGKTNVDLQNYGQQVASQGWNNYVNQLQPYLNMSQGAASNIGNLQSSYGNQVANQFGNLGNQSAGLYGQSANLYSNLGNQQAGQYANLGNQLAGQFGSLGSQVAGQYANLGTQSANLYSGLGNQLAGQYGQLGQGLNQNQMQGGQLNAGIYTGLGTNLANSYTNQGQAAYGGQTSIGNANANADLASATASGNIWNTLIGGASALAGAPSSFYKTAGNVGSAIGNTFTGGSGSGPYPSNGLNWSDIRIKDGIEKLTELADGTNVYRFRYKGDPTRRTHIGVMAQEVEKTHPEAVYDIGGIKAVDYGAVTDRAAALMKLAA